MAIDPGRDKCGIAVVSPEGALLLHKIIASGELVSQIICLAEQYAFSTVVLGNGTTSAATKAKLQEALTGVKLVTVDEYKTTELARREYWKLYPPKGWRRLVPLSLQVPPCPVDDFAAYLLARRYLQAHNVQKMSPASTGGE